MSTAIALFMYNRIDYIENIFSAINSQKIISDIFCFIDFDVSQPELQYTLSSFVNSLCSDDKYLKIILREKNYGSGRNVNSGLDLIFVNYSKCIVLEDDTIPCSSFFEYMNLTLARYENDARVGIVTGSNYGARFYPQFSEEIGFSRTMTLWGWGIWKDRWLAYREISDTAYHRYLLNNSIWINIPAISKQFLTSAFIHHFSNQSEAWDIPLVMYLLLSNRLCAFPAKNLIENAGISDGKGVHPNVGYKKIPADLNFRITRFPTEVLLDNYYEDLLSMFQAKSLGWINPIGIPNIYHQFWYEI